MKKSKRGRPRKTQTVNGKICELAQWTSSCTGCYESLDGHPVGEYPYDKKAGCHVGSGCHECGYTGKRRQAFWVPLEG